jgi:molybdate transport system ATP-binding protein
MSLAVDVRLRRGDFILETAFRSSGRVTALFGRSGSGKTSLLHLIAGLLRPDAGRIVVDEEVLVDTAKRLYLPPHRRRVGYVFQDARLFPHLNVMHNLTYGRRFAPRGAAVAALDDIVSLLGLQDLLMRRPASLSGGEAQRVAIGRALLAGPRILLLDEPLSSLDESRKQEVLPYIEGLRDSLGVPIVYVSHVPAEVERLATSVIGLKNGRCVAPAEAGMIPRP